MKCYYFLAIILITGVQASSDELTQKLKKWSSECTKETKISQESLEKLRNPEPTDDPRLKVYVLCFLEKMDIMNENGDLKKENLRTVLLEAGNGEEKTERLVKKCAVEKHRPEDTAYEGFLCWYKNKNLV
ncbi:hypothetical protein Zmor_027243 [Zophobas morio]|uniref:Uncharacterized protein n=1 Tax=Zophobas morio TaxID=2755281 RepID=A0AA38HMU8_9CUCU|nr:hypothetical protein Zmor_027243 [Zophobas morio]